MIMQILSALQIIKYIFIDNRGKLLKTWITKGILGLILIEKSVTLMVSPVINKNDQWHADFHTANDSVMNVNIPAVLF